MFFLFLLIFFVVVEDHLLGVHIICHVLLKEEFLVDFLYGVLRFLFNVGGACGLEGLGSVVTEDAVGAVYI